MARFGKQRGKIGETGLLLDRDDVGARYGDVIHGMFGKMKQVADHLALDRRQVALGGRSRAFVLLLLVIFVERFLQFLPQRRGFVIAEQKRLYAAP